jgi:hypothetical protein
MKNETNLIQIKDKETIKDLLEIKNKLEAETGLRISGQNVVNHLLKIYKERTK